MHIFASNYVPLLHMLLILSGDVKTNPGPDDVSQLDLILEAITRIEVGQASMLTAISALRIQQTTTDSRVKELMERVTAFEQTFASANLPPIQSTLVTDHSTVPAELSDIRARCDDAENRLRRSNLLFFGIPDSLSENWSQ